MQGKLNKFLLSLLFLDLLGCGGSAPNDSLTGEENIAKVKEFNGLTSLTKQDDNSWVLKWSPIDVDGIVYSVFKAPSNNPFDYEKPLISTKQNIYRYVPENIFTENITCFNVRITNVSGDENIEQQCTTDTPLTFSGLIKIERQAGGEYLLGWNAIPVSGVIYSIYESKNGADYTFDQPSIDALKNNFYKTNVVDRGQISCFIVRYHHKELTIDENLIELCTEEEEPISFGGVSSVTQVSSSEAKISWQLSSSQEVVSYNIYNGSDFKELVKTVDSKTVEITIKDLSPGTQYDFGVRAVDEYGREDKNVKILPIILE